MAILKQAKAMVIHPRVSGRGWNKIRQASKPDVVAGDLTEQAKRILGGSLDPDQYLFTHCTIVASVDVESAPGVKLGRILQGTKTVNRRFADYYIKPACNEYVNNNGDSWARAVLKKSFHTFIGGHNFQEHVQIEEKSKGRILDAVSRDIGDSLYIDILVATNRKHSQLVKDILSQNMTTLSMGCTTDFTICSKCGHVAADETELCDCVRYEKLNTFIDDSGVKRVVAELCGHESAGDTGGVRFIEASWVGSPAFQGAVLRNILALQDTGRAESEIRKLLASPAPYSSADWSEGAILKAASSSRAAEDFGDTPDDAAPEAPPAPPPEKAPFQDLEDEVYKSVSDRVRQRIKKDLTPKPSSNAPTDWTNDTIVKEGSTSAPARVIASEINLYKRTISAACHAASSQVAVVNAVADINDAFGIRVNRDLYRLALNIGPITDPTVYVATCRKHAKRPLSQTDLRVMIRLGTLITKWASKNQVPQSSPQE